MNRITAPHDPRRPEEIDASVDNSISRIADTIEHLNKAFTKSYTALNYAGFVTVAGMVLVTISLALGKIPFLNLTFDEQKLYVLVGAGFVLLGMVAISLKNLFIYRHQLVQQETARQMLAMRIAAIGETQAAAMKGMAEAAAPDKDSGVSFGG